MQSHPSVQVVLETDISQNIERRVLDSEVEIVAFVASNSPLIGKRLTFKELAQIPLVVLRTSKIYMELIAQSYDPNVAVPCDEPDAVKAMVQKGVGIGLTYRDVIRNLKTRTTCAETRSSPE